MNNKGVQLLEELRKVPNFNPRVMEQDLDEINLNWETANKVLYSWLFSVYFGLAGNCGGSNLKYSYRMLFEIR